ncbi:MAG: arginine--tRNA ligase [Salinivirgaceae bacterium]|jgi:arginyl-tRNA synthetase|nr:arginine--tRNA ligase [Salinivirgaceae bacterium]
MEIITLLKDKVAEVIKELYAAEVNDKMIQFQKTRKEFEGDFTLVVFPFLKIAKKGPEQAAQAIGEELEKNVDEISNFNVVKGFLNLKLTDAYWVDFLNAISKQEKFGIVAPETSGKTIMVEYSSPNTNKPLHLGHIRNNLLGYSVAEILKANGHKVLKVNLVNDRGIHICKSMLAWQKWGSNETPESTGLKGDKLVGNYYVRFDQEYKKEIAALMASGKTEDEAKDQANLIQEAREMLRNWEAGDIEVNELWATMNRWVYKGFDVTYKAMGVDFDKIYYESETYKLGKAIVLDGLEKGILIQKEDGSIWADLTADGLDHKILLRSDGTSVYMTQDIGTAHQRFSEFNLHHHTYVVGNEQNYHFQVLKLVLKKLGHDWSDNINHLSYGMVELPEGKMKSREGTVVDADDLIEEMVLTAKETSLELGKLEDMSDADASNVFNMIGLGALKYFILKVDPKKTMMFNPQESIDFNGNTGPFIQYTHARIKSVLRKAENAGFTVEGDVTNAIMLSKKEQDLTKLIFDFPETIAEAGRNHSPAVVANYIYDLAKEYNQFYHDHSVVKEENADKRAFRIQISKKVADTIKLGAMLLGMEVPERM